MEGASDVEDTGTSRLLAWYSPSRLGLEELEAGTGVGGVSEVESSVGMEIGWARMGLEDCA